MLCERVWERIKLGIEPRLKSYIKFGIVQDFERRELSQRQLFLSVGRTVMSDIVVKISHL